MIAMGVQPSEIERLEWRKYQTLILGRAMGELAQKQAQPLSDEEQMMLQHNAMDVLLNGPEPPRTEEAD